MDEESGVLPLTQPEAPAASDSPAQHHLIPRQPGPERAEPSGSDVLTAEAPSQTRSEAPSQTRSQTRSEARSESPAPFVRPATDDIDFHALVRRADQRHAARWVAWTTCGLAGLALIAFLLTGALALVGVVAVGALATVGAAGTSLVLGHAPVPYLSD